MPRAACVLAVLLFGCTGPVTGGPPTEDAPVSYESLGCAADDGGEGPVLTYSGDAACGAHVYADACAQCHGDSGEGLDEYPALEDHVRAHTDLDLVVVLTRGTGDMDDPEIANDAAAHVLAWLRDTFGEYDGEGHR